MTRIIMSKVTQLVSDRDMTQSKESNSRPCTLNHGFQVEISFISAVGRKTPLKPKSSLLCLRE